MFIRVESFIGRNGRAIPNQYKIHTSEGTYFQSYDTIIAFKRKDGEVFLDENYWDYSRTTVKYLGIFLGLSKKSIWKKIKNNEFKLKDLDNGCCPLLESDI